MFQGVPNEPRCQDQAHCELEMGVGRVNVSSTALGSDLLDIQEDLAM